jgi:hypothetical protein
MHLGKIPFSQGKPILDSVKITKSKSFNLSTITSVIRARPKASLASLATAIVVVATLLTSGSSVSAWWTQAPVVSAGINSSRALITLENDQTVKSSMLVVRNNLSRSVTKVQILPSYFDRMAVNDVEVLIAKSGISRAQCINTATDMQSAPLDLPEGLRITGVSIKSDKQFFIWGRGQEGQTTVFSTDCTAVILVATADAPLNRICPIKEQIIAIDSRGSVLMTNEAMKFEATTQRYRHLNLLTCGDNTLVGHLKNASGDFLVMVGAKSATIKPMVKGKGLFALLYHQQESQWYGLKHGKTTSTVGLIPIVF